jgi:hypothetical protein
VGAALPFDPPPDAQERREHTAGAGGGPACHERMRLRAGATRRETKR